MEVLSKMEIATYIGMANIMLAQASDEIEKETGTSETTDLMDKVRSALAQAQLILTAEALNEFSEEVINGHTPKS